MMQNNKPGPVTYHKSSNQEKWRFSLYAAILFMLCLTGVLLLHCSHNSSFFIFYPSLNTSSSGVEYTGVASTHTPPLKPGSVHKLKLVKEGFIDQLRSLTFKNNGIVKASDKFVWKNLPCHYVESQNVTAPYVSWSDNDHFNYMFRQVGSDDVVHPPSGIRSSVPLGGIATGVFELRGDGSFHEWTIFNQHPAGAAKIQLLDDVFMGLRTQIVKGNTTENVSLVLQTHPINAKLPGVRTLEYQGSHPVSKLTLLDTRVPIEASVYAYPWYKHNDMNVSATPAVAFTAVLHNPLNTEVNTSFMFNLPIGMEPHTQRMAKQMPRSVSHRPSVRSEDAPSLRKSSVIDEIDCFRSCNKDDFCQSWSYDVKENVCIEYFSDVRLNGHLDGSFAGVRSSWSKDNDCITINRDTPGSSANGNMSLCVVSSDEDVTTSFGFNDDITTLWEDFSSNGGFPSSPNGPYVSGAVSGSVRLSPGETKEVTIVMGWYFPDRDFLGLPVGNYYRHLVQDSADAARYLSDNLDNAVADISKLHSTFFDSNLPVTLQDMLINSLSHIRSAFWLEDGRWRQWEAQDCVNIDSVHNDGERHIPYIMIFPETVINKMYAWARFQQSDGMIQEQLRCGCMSLPILPITVEYGCGRKMSDVSSMFIVYLLELLQWHPGNTTHQVVQDLWPNAKKAAQWQMDVSRDVGMPGYVWTTYDYVFMDSYPVTTYSGAFHLLAMKAAEKLANFMGDFEFAFACNEEFHRSQDLLDEHLWNDTAQYYNAYSTTTEQFNAESYFNGSKLNLCEYPEFRPEGAREEDCLQGRPDTPGAIMTDTFYAQVLAYSLGLGVLVKYEDRLKRHMKAELEYNDSPYGLLVVTGRYPEAGPDSDNSLWMMGNPNWASISLHLGEDSNLALEVATKSFDQWRSVLHEQWNVAGILGGIGYGGDGLPHITSHYGFYMSSWHIVMAVSGQHVDMSERIITFAPKLQPPFKIPFFIPTVWGYLQSDLAPRNVSRPEELYVFYTLGLQFGSVEIELLSVGSCKFELPVNKVTVNITADSVAKWHCLYT